jgi:hypothetical protein
MSTSRKITDRVWQLAEDGLLTWETIAKEALSYMSEDDVADMARCADWLDGSGEEDYDDEE